LTVRNLLISGVVLLLAYAAFDDIMTDNATIFLPEYAILGVAAVWFAWLGVTTLRRRWRHA
jgi:membrane associated rhomboid family serine protease